MTKFQFLTRSDCLKRMRLISRHRSFIEQKFEFQTLRSSNLFLTRPKISLSNGHQNGFYHTNLSNTIKYFESRTQTCCLSHGSTSHDCFLSGCFHHSQLAFKLDRIQSIHHYDGCHFLFFRPGQLPNYPYKLHHCIQTDFRTTSTWHRHDPGSIPHSFRVHFSWILFRLHQKSYLPWTK